MILVQVMVCVRSNKTWVLFSQTFYSILFASWYIFIPDNKLGPSSVLYHVQIVSKFVRMQNYTEKVTDMSWSIFYFEFE